MNAQNSVQRFATLLVNQQLGVDINFTSVERAMLLNNFEEQVLEPGIARLAAGVENFTTGSSQQRSEIHWRVQHDRDVRPAAAERAVSDGSPGP